MRTILITLIFSIMLITCSNENEEPIEASLKDELNDHYVLVHSSNGISYRMLPDGSQLVKIANGTFPIWINNKESFAVYYSRCTIHIYNSKTLQFEKSISLQKCSDGDDLNYSPLLNRFIFTCNNRIAFCTQNGQMSEFNDYYLSNLSVDNVDSWIYYLNHKDGTTDIYRVKPDNSQREPVALTSTFDYAACSVSRDGKFLVASVSNSTERSLSIINTVTKNISTFALPGKITRIDGTPTFSRGGEFIYFSSENSLYIISRNGLKLTEIISSDTPIYVVPSW